MDVVLRSGRPSDGPVLTEIAFESKRHWGYPDDWMARWRQALTITPAYLGGSLVVVADVDGRAVAFYALVGSAQRWDLDHLWVRPAYIGRGIGSQLFRHAVGALESRAPGATLAIESEPNAEQFYIRMGAQRVGETTRDWQGLRRTLPQLELPIGGHLTGA